jgi:hypothetical protein
MRYGGSGYGTFTWLGKSIAHAGNIENKEATIGTSLTTIATIAGVDITAKIGSYATSNHTHKIKTHGTEYTIAAPGGNAVDIGDYVKVAGDTMTGTLIMKTNGTGNYNQGIRINRVSTSDWALLLIGKSGTAT